jgi:hypothetical protein
MKPGIIGVLDEFWGRIGNIQKIMVRYPYVNDGHYLTSGEEVKNQIRAILSRL